MDLNKETGSGVEAIAEARVDGTQDNETQSSSASESDAGRDGTVGADYDKDFCVVPECYERQLAILIKFYAKYESAKSESDCRAILDKRKGDADAMTTLQFSKLCVKLAAKYGANPMDAPLAAAQQTAATPEGVGGIDAELKQSDCKVAIASPQAGWNATKHKQAACGSTWACEVCLVKNDNDVLLCAACETCKPGCEEEATRAKQDAQDQKEEEMKENMLASVAAVKAAGITFGLPSSSGVNNNPAVLSAPTAGLSKWTSAKAQPLSNQGLADMDAAGALDWLTEHVRLDEDGMQVVQTAFRDKPITGALLEAATMQTLKSKYGIASWGVRLKIHLALSEYQEQQRTAVRAGVGGVQQIRMERNAVKTFSPIRSPRSALSAIRVN